MGNRYGAVLLLMAEAFFGYLLPWGQMSFWGAQVITSLFGAIPYVGDTLALWLRGDYNIADATLHRFLCFTCCFNTFNYGCPGLFAYSCLT